MSESQIYWQILSSDNPPNSFIQSVKNYTLELPRNYLAELLWQRGIKDHKQLAGFLDAQQYQPASPLEFGTEMNNAIERIISAKNHQEKIAIWGDFDADGITSTSVLWDGLGQFFQQNHQLTYYIPNRFTESHGLNCPGIEQLAKQDFSLIITCDTGSTNIAEIEYAKNLGIDIIVTDHHTLPSERPPLLAIINPRYFPTTHPLYHLSGVAVAYKLIEALYLTKPEIPKLPLKELLDLVAIGLIADLVQLTGDCRYLAQIGIQQLKQTTRPGVVKLLELCKRTGDRPTDISFGIGPRINAVSRIMGDASFCVELLTSRDPHQCQQLAMETELANTRRKSLQKEVARDVTQKLTQLDLSTTNAIVLSDPQWPVGVLGLVAGQIAQEYGRPTILLSVETEEVKTSQELLLARGSARSVGQIDLYQLVKNQAHLLHRFGGHPFAAGLSLPVENIPIFTDAINQLLRQQLGSNGNLTPIVVDLIVTVSELGKKLFQELKLLEPCGMGNPAPKLLIQNCWFTDTWHKNQKDLHGKKVQYIKTDFEIWDDSTDNGFPGIWWGHYKDEIPQERCDALVELDFNTYKKRYEVRLITLQPCLQETPVSSKPVDWILDWRNGQGDEKMSNNQQDLMILRECPTSWNELRIWFRRAMNRQQKLAIAYSLPPKVPPTDIWQQLLGIAKYLSRTGQPVTRYQILAKLGIGDTTLKLGFQAIQHLCFNVKYRNRAFYIMSNESRVKPSENLSEVVEKFLGAISESQFRQQYFCAVSFKTIEAIATQTALEDINTSIPF
ncbi:MAG: single-stranded-DNA-specific exonuclease RecJ [Microcoleaceae cyanobacterium]